jgi:hypothetical protein
MTTDTGTTHRDRSLTPSQIKQDGHQVRCSGTPSPTQQKTKPKTKGRGKPGRRAKSKDLELMIVTVTRTRKMKIICFGFGSCATHVIIGLQQLFHLPSPSHRHDHQLQVFALCSPAWFPSPLRLRLGFLLGGTWCPAASDLVSVLLDLTWCLSCLT